jgi:Protein of unknown function (DUF3102)
MRHISQNLKHRQFEYQNLPIQQRAVIQKLTIEIKKNIRTTVQTSWEIGKKLVEARDQLEHSQFKSWLQVEFEWSRRTAYNFIRIYEAFPEFASANFAQLNISISALYLLAAPSTQLEIRHDFLGRALAGEHISHKVIQTAIQSVRTIQNNQETSLTIPDVDNASRSILQIEDLMPDLIASQPPMAENITKITSDLHPAWNQIGSELSLFWGDTTSPRFIERLPEQGFVLAVPFRQWHHDWLVNESRSCIIIARPKLEQELVESLLSALATSESALIFPWIPSWKMVAFALNLNIKVYAGDPNLQQCEQMIAKLGLSGAKIERMQW